MKNNSIKIAYFKRIKLSYKYELCKSCLIWFKLNKSSIKVFEENPSLVTKTANILDICRFFLSKSFNYMEGVLDAK
ncbi:hypothetical protein SAMN05444267_10432 [Chryseobacterium polytrichastri]|uniref:Uncharacterized protein n=1 Tax=Chryseobacterium polytrichastri TaxID=1302687 RepID=A0A1M7HXP6_9FLAO|nr:hypothetical protein SAMN05444267_10432 [Chryseobacterium polytrichastri]